jgi:hypothetical protein
MVKLELPHINLLTKMDLAEDKAAIDEYRIPDKQMLLDRYDQDTLCAVHFGDNPSSSAVTRLLL